MKKILYHGSEKIIEKPIFGMGASNNDYGKGFYCTESMELAKEWACARNNDGYVNIYELDLSNLNVLYLNNEEYTILHWLAILAKYRTYWERGSISETAKKYIEEHYFINLADYDCIVGYRADDSYFSFAQDFVSGAISLAQLSEAMYLGELGEQIVLKSKKAFEQIVYLGNEEASKDEYFMRKNMRDKIARKEYRRSRNKVPNTDDIFILDIMRNGGDF